MTASNDWVIDGGRVDSTVFFEILHDTFPEATAFFVEGTSMEEDVIDCYLKHIQPGEFLPDANTLWPVSRKIRCAFDNALFKELAFLSERHAEPELLDHLSVYEEETPLLEWHDAFSNDSAMVLPFYLLEERIAAFAKQLNRPYTRWNLL